MKNVLYIYIILMAGITFLTCSNPLKEDQPEKTRVRILVDETLGKGRWIFYWDGKNDKGEYQPEGKYLYSMDTREFTEISYMTAQEGGLPGKNNLEHFEPGIWYDFELEPADPDPFRIKEGVNIAFKMKETARVKIQIFKD